MLKSWMGMVPLMSLLASVSIEDDEIQGGGDAVHLNRFRSSMANTEDDDPTDDDDDGDGIRVEDDEVVMSRSEKKAQRRKLIDELNHQRIKNAEMAERLARLEGAQSAMTMQQGVVDQTDDEDDVEAQIAAIQDRHMAAYRELEAKGANATQADHDAYKKLVRKLDVEKHRVVARSLMSDMSAQQAQAARSAVIREKYADVYTDNRYVGYAEGEYRKLLAEGHPDGDATLERAMNASRERFGLMKKPPPGDGSKARFAANSPRAGGAPPADGGVVRVKLDKATRKIAMAAFAHLPDEESRVKAWIKTPAGKAYARRNRS